MQPLRADPMLSTANNRLASSRNKPPGSTGALGDMTGVEEGGPNLWQILGRGSETLACFSVFAEMVRGAQS